MLGVEPAEPGFGVAHIEPVLGDLAWAKGAVPSASGMIHIDARTRGRADEVDVVESPVVFESGGRQYGPGRHRV